MKDCGLDAMGTFCCFRQPTLMCIPLTKGWKVLTIMSDIHYKHLPLTVLN